ncbi:MAG TPA: HAD family hydrolase [Candidatus Limnocylindrales bacterium]|nr:HAD family hydrolase [Candidatus Limnocylindrales bacterium]
MAARLAAIDLDGTLLRRDGSVSERSRRAIASALGRGIDVVIVSARGPRGVAEIAGAAGVSGTAICSNGGILLDLDTGSIARARPLQPAVAIDLVRKLRERLPGIVFAMEYDDFAYEPGFAAWNWTPPSDSRVGDAVELLGEPAAKLILRHEEHTLEAIAEAAGELAGDDAEVMISGEWTVEVTAAGVDKAAALAELCAERGLDAADVVAFGDMPNDLPMLAWAGRAIAVANAHPDVLAAADEVTAANDDDGVAIVLERL